MPCPLFANLCLLFPQDRTYKRGRGESVVDPKEKSAVLEEAEHWSLTTLREKLVKIGAKIVRHGRYVIFQMAEVAIPRELFADILRRIDRLRPAPLPT